MNDAKLYADSNDLQRRDAKDLINEFKHFFANIQNAKILDIGTGTGDVFVEILLPSLKYKPIQVIGTDKSQEMIRFSSEKCRSESIQLIFKELNIESDFLNDETLEWKIESFDLITSFYCQQWIQDQCASFSNIHQLLKPKGIFFFYFPNNHPVLDIYVKFSKDKDYSPYMKNICKMILPYYFEKDPVKAVKKNLESVKFKIIHLELREFTFIYENEEVLINFLKSINPFLNKMPLEMQVNYLKDCLAHFDDSNLTQIDNVDGTKRFITPYKLMIAVVKK